MRIFIYFYKSFQIYIRHDASSCRIYLTYISTKLAYILHPHLEIR